MKISCEIIKDLLPLYHDGVCSVESKELVEEHLIDCDNCRKELQSVDDFQIQQKQQNLQEAEVIKKLSERWKKIMLKSVFKGVLSTVVMIGVLVFVLYLIMDVRIVPTPY